MGGRNAPNNSMSRKALRMSVSASLPCPPLHRAGLRVPAWLQWAVCAGHSEQQMTLDNRGGDADMGLRMFLELLKKQERNVCSSFEQLYLCIRTAEDVSETLEPEQHTNRCLSQMEIKLSATFLQ